MTLFLRLIYDRLTENKQTDEQMSAEQKLIVSGKN